MFDTVISGGQVFEGTGAAGGRSDVGITRDRIDAVGELSAAERRHTIDASDRIVCPGFIDVHSHSDTYLLIEPSADSKTLQGVTTEVVGNCGASAAPLHGAYQLPSDWRDKPYGANWSTVAEYRARLEEAHPAPNVILLAGHNTLRAGVMGYENRLPTDQEQRLMVQRLEQALDEGARGLSTGLIYAPGMYAKTDEIVRLATLVAARQGIYASHMRSESGRLLDAVAEALGIGRRAGVRVQISHLKATGSDNWHCMDTALAAVKKAQSEAVDAAADRYPYTASCTDLDIVLPAWAQEGGREATLARMRDTATLRRLREELLQARPESYWQSVTIGSTHHPDNTALRGLPLVDAAKQLKMTPVDTVLYLVRSDELRTSAFFCGMSEENMLRVLSEPWVMIGSDASLRRPSGPLSEDYPHPRAYGAFPRFLRMALDGKTVPLAEAVRKMTALPAARFGLADRGIVRTGMKADLVVFAPATIRDKASYANPHQFPDGIEQVFVNGVLTVSGGELTGRRGGRFL